MINDSSSWRLILDTGPTLIVVVVAVVVGGGCGGAVVVVVVVVVVVFIAVVLVVYPKRWYFRVMPRIKQEYNTTHIRSALHRRWCYEVFAGYRWNQTDTRHR